MVFVSLSTLSAGSSIMSSEDAKDATPVTNSTQILSVWWLQLNTETQDAESSNTRPVLNATTNSISSTVSVDPTILSAKASTPMAPAWTATEATTWSKAVACCNCHHLTVSAS